MYKTVLIGLTSLALLCRAVNLAESREPPQDYSRLVQLIQLQDREAPLYVFNDFEQKFDQDSHQSNLKYFNSHPELLKKIKNDLDGDALQWRIENLELRLLFVPELRKEYAALYEDYCRHVVSYILAETQLANPFRAIRTPVEEKPEIPDDGITVFLVHNLTKEYVADYCFFNRRDKKVNIQLSGKIEVGEVGSYTSTLNFKDSGKIEFIQNHYTVWQNSAANPYTALMVPAEETLHIALRKFTENAIQASLKRHPVQNLEEAKQVVEKWIEVEEAVVGGIVHTLLGNFLADFVPNLSPGLMEKDLNTKSEFKRYTLLAKGIDVVKHMGPKAAIRIYADNPLEFKKLIDEFASSKGDDAKI